MLLLSKERLLANFRPLLLLIILSIKRHWVQRKNQVNLLKVLKGFNKVFLTILFQNILSSKELLACIRCFQLFTKIKKGSKTSFWCTFLHIFPIKLFLVFNTHQLTRFQYQLNLPSHNIKQYVSLNSSLFNWWRHKL